MKKKYTPCSIPLFVGLLSLNTLSSCSNTKQELGMGWVDDLSRNIRNIRRTVIRHPRKAAALGVGAVVAIGGLATGLTLSNLHQAGSAVSTGPGTTTTSTPWTENGLNYSTTMLAPWTENGLNYSTATLAPWTENSLNDSTATLAPWTENSLNDSTTTPAPWTGKSSTEFTITEAILSSLPTLSPEEQLKLNDLLFQAIADGNRTEIESLIHNNPTLDVDAKDKDNNTPLMKAVLAKDENIVELLLHNGANVDEKGGPHNNTPLIEAVLTEDKSIVRILVEDYKANVNLKNDKGETALSVADNSRIERVLRQYGATR